VDAFDRNLASVAVKCYTSCTLNGICKDNAAINVFRSTQKGSFPSTLMGPYYASSFHEPFAKIVQQTYLQQPPSFYKHPVSAQQYTESTTRK
jgi:hypothetical protein